MKFSYLAFLHCPKCHKEYHPKDNQKLCSCGSPLLVNYDLEQLKKDIKPEIFRTRRTDLWRYHELLPVQSEKNIVTLGEGMTPLLPVNKLGDKVGINNFYIKDEGVIPTGTFKARGAAVGVSRIKEAGVEKLIMPTNGNAGAAWSLYGTRAGIETTIVMPEDSPKITMKECTAAGAELYLVNGLISDAGQIVGRAEKNHGYFNAATLKEPYRIEGKKTMGIEILEQLNWEVPDVILYPTGGGVGLIGIYKMLKELQELGWISQKLPRLVAVQAEECAPIVRAWEEGKLSSEPWENGNTVAFGINVPKALGDFLVLEALYETEGCAIAIDDQSLLEDQKEIAETEGLFICPEGAATITAAKQLRQNGWIKEEETVVALNTGAGIKYPDTVDFDVPVLEPHENIKGNFQKI